MYTDSRPVRVETLTRAERMETLQESCDIRSHEVQKICVSCLNKLTLPGLPIQLNTPYKAHDFNFRESACILTLGKYYHFVFFNIYIRHFHEF